MIKTKKLVMYEVKSMKSKITPYVKGDKISFDVNVESVGRLSENWSESEEAFKNTFLKRVEQSAQQEVRQLVKHTLQKFKRNIKLMLLVLTQV